MNSTNTPTTNLPVPILDRMRYLEHLDRRQPGAGTVRLRQISSQTGEFLITIARQAPQGRFIEIGTGGGYSALWISRVCAERNIPLTTFEQDPLKIAIATQTFKATATDQNIHLIPENAALHLDTLNTIAFCFLDSTKDTYLPFYEKIIPRLETNGILAIDNIISHKRSLRTFIAHVQADPRVNTTIADIGTGVMVCRKIDKLKSRT